VSIDLINHMVHEISQLSRSTSNVDLNTHSAMNEAMELEYIHQMQELWYQSSRAVHKLGSCNRSIFQAGNNVKYTEKEIHATTSIRLQERTSALDG